MNRILQLFFIILIPFYPIWAWLSYTFTGRHINLFVSLTLILVIIYLVINKKARMPVYLIFLILFTVFDQISSFINNIFLSGSNLFYVLLVDKNILACTFFFVIENTYFDKGFFLKMNKYIFIVIIASLIVSFIQIINPEFFISPELISDSPRSYISENRNFSIYSWLNLNTLGVSFPIMISILLSTFSMEKKFSTLTVISGIVVSFLSRARYVMLSTIIVLSQLFFSSKYNFKKKIAVMLAVIVSIILLVEISKVFNLDLGRIISERILEKGTNMESARARITSYYVFLQKFPENPWIGVGPATRDDVLWLLGGVAPMIHVGYLSYLYYYGIIGFLLFFLSLIFLLIDAWKVGKTYMFWGSFYGLLAFCVANFTMVYFNFSEMGIILAVIYLRYYNQLKPGSSLALTKPLKPY